MEKCDDIVLNFLLVSASDKHSSQYSNLRPMKQPIGKENVSKIRKRVTYSQKSILYTRCILEITERSL